MMMALSRYGFREWLTISVVAVLASVVSLWFGAWYLVIPIGLAWCAGGAFFRDPLGRRPATGEDSDMVSPADGRISAIEDVDHHEATNGPARIIRIFLSVLNVHVNRMPCDGTIAGRIYKPGRHLDARTEESARVNESMLVMLEITTGETIGIRQVSGAIARRIVCRAEQGQHFTRGERYGMIKFGSTTELILPRPTDVTTRVTVGQKVTGGVTILATLGEASDQAARSSAP
ncbi:MAG: phosphatidylserine decarboxylase family protein [Phycisphaerae bacterium]|nr:phosphatidylserine decarboxylase family protein [Phycisphaerae bacterium]